ncbi:sulfate ABC transporter permease [Babesia ovata]|uniref:Sulfate ABC transporter permease n=1 Tax=Babesia ovata TaxID=189622 RepID=A0A2H6K6H0_9APIC|nr:sulfate ABC transporter permease [Babesia ovata]GBE58581.1 sulfate ABC transporter permease [Babesia ovata]
MSQLYIRRSRSIVNDESLSESVFTTPGDWDCSMNLAVHRKHRSEFKIECVFPSAGFLKQLLLPINPSLGGRNAAVFKVNAFDYANNQMKSLFYIHLVFDPNCELSPDSQQLESAQAMYTCVRVPKSRLLKYSITSMDGSDYRHIVDIAVPLQSLMVCLNMYSHKQEMVMTYDSDDRQIVLNGRCVSYAEYWHTSDIGQSMVCRLKTINLNPLQLPFDGSDFNFVDVDYFSISPKLLYPCLHDIASDSASSKLVLELVPPDDTNSRCVLGLGKRDELEHSLLGQATTGEPAAVNEGEARYARGLLQLLVGETGEPLGEGPPAGELLPALADTATSPLSSRTLVIDVERHALISWCSLLVLQLIQKTEERHAPRSLDHEPRGVGLEPLLVDLYELLLSD